MLSNLPLISKMMPGGRYILCFIFLLLLANKGIGQYQGRTTAGFTVSGINGAREINDDFSYDIELFPGQEFAGYIYFWTTDGGAAYGEFHENPGVDWLNVSPTHITADGCEEPVPVRFAFKAPQKTGKYTTTVEDYEYNWSDIIITLVVTEQPDSNLTDSSIILSGEIDTYYRYQEHKYTGLDVDQSWYDKGYCGQDPYVFSPTRLITRSVHPAWTGVSFSPASFTLQLGGSQVVAKTFRVDENTPDLLYETIFLEWKSFPAFIKWKFIPADEYCLGWEKIPSLNYPSLASGAVIYRDSLYVIGGLDPFSQAPTGRAEVLRDNRWGLLQAALNEPRYGFACGVLEDRIYVFGGMDGNNQPLNTVEYFDGTRWLVDPDSMPVPLCFHSGAAHNSTFYFFGGKSRKDQTYDNSLMKFSPAKGWKVLHESLPFSHRESYGCVITEELIFIIGGVYSQGDKGDSTWFDEVYRYDITADTFTTISPMNHARADFACGFAGGFIYVAGGTSSDPGVASSVEFLDPVSGNWFTCEEAPDLSVFSPAFTVVDDHLFLLGGSVSLPGSGPDYRSCYGSDFFSGDGDKPDEPPVEMQVFPNPFLEESVITFYLPYDSHVRLALYDLSGRLVRKLADESMQAGEYQYAVDGSFLAEGIYLGELKTDKHHVVMKIVKIEE